MEDKGQTARHDLYKMCKGSSDFEPVYDLAGEELLCSGVIAGVDVSSFSERGQFSINLEDTQRLNTPVRLELKVLRVPDQKLITLLARNNYKNQWHNFLSGCRLRDCPRFFIAQYSKSRGKKGAMTDRRI